MTNGERILKEGDSKEALHLFDVFAYSQQIPDVLYRLLYLRRRVKTNLL